MVFTFCAHDLDLLNDTAQYKLFHLSLAEHCFHHLSIKTQATWRHATQTTWAQLTSIILLFVRYFLTFN